MATSLDQGLIGASLTLQSGGILMTQISGPVLIQSFFIGGEMLTTTGGTVPTVACDQNVTPTCTPLTVDQNHWATELKSYKSVPDYLWQTEAIYGWFNAAGALGVF